jgi:hypothetical protein
MVGKRDNFGSALTIRSPALTYFHLHTIYLPTSSKTASAGVHFRAQKLQEREEGFNRSQAECNGMNWYLKFRQLVASAAIVNPPDRLPRQSGNLEEGVVVRSTSIRFEGYKASKNSSAQIPSRQVGE